LRFISLPLRRTASTPRETRFARLDLGLFTKSSIRISFCESISLDDRRKKNPLPPWGAGNGFFYFSFLGVRLGHYQPFLIIADEDTGDDNNKAKKDDNYKGLNHAVTLVFLKANSRHQRSQVFLFLPMLSDSIAD
jgi:hypothetical protein